MTLKEAACLTRILAPVLFIASLVSGCGGTFAAQSDAQKVAATLTGNGKLAAPDNPQCKLFTPAEVTKYIGQAVSAGQASTMGMGCQWVATHGSGDVMVSVVPADYHERPTLAKGFQEVPDVGAKGFVAQDLGGWIAGAIVGKDAIRVSVAGAAASETSALALLKETIKRRAS
jgi:hypothetical protein